MTILLLSPRYTEDSIAVRQAALDSGWSVLRLPSWRPTDDLEAEDALAYGEPLFVAAVCHFLGLVPLEPPFEWLSRLPTEYLHRNVTFSTLAKARSTHGPLFIKPADDKCFKAQVYQSGADLPPIDLLPEGTPVLISEPVSWSIEFRAFVRHGAVETISPYLRNGALAKDEDGQWVASDDDTQSALALLADILSNRSIAVPPGVVIDVGLIPGRGWAVVEANPCWGSGIYGCDPSAVCRVIRAAIKPANEVTQDDRRWIPSRDA